MMIKTFFGRVLTVCDAGRPDAPATAIAAVMNSLRLDLANNVTSLGRAAVHVTIAAMLIQRLLLRRRPANIGAKELTYTSSTHRKPIFVVALSGVLDVL